MALLALALLLFIPPAGAQTIVDYDDDDDGLIDLRTPAQFNAIRHDANGNGDATHAAYVSAFPDRQTGATDRMGCPGGTCTGYELRADLTLTGGWSPIAVFNATLNGNGHTISGVSINSNSANVGLFGELDGSGVIRQVGIIEPSVRSNNAGGAMGGLVGFADDGSMIDASYVQGGTLTMAAANLQMGGLVGDHEGTIRASYASASLRTADPCSACNSNWAGGLVGHLNGGVIIASYATGPNVITGIANRTGGLVGRTDDPGGGLTTTITDSYCDRQATRQTNCIGQWGGSSQ